jgi:membrane protein required for colicin V production
MNWLDIVILAIIVIATFLGLWIGLIRAALFLAGIIVGVFLAGRYYIPLSQHLSFVGDESVARVVAFVIILVAVMLVALLLALFLNRLTSLVPLGWVNRLGGAIFGLFLGALFWGAVLAIWVKYLGSNNTIEGSVLARFLLDRFPMVLALLPAEFDSVRAFFQ